MQPDRPFARIRSNSYDVPGNQNVPPSRPEIHTRSNSAHNLSQFVPDSMRGPPEGYTSSPAEISRSNSPSEAPIRGPNQPYLNAGMNVSAPVLNTMGAPPMAHRSTTNPQPSKKLSFAQNLSVHTTWPPNVYDRRGDQATCNKLTPALAQRIKWVYAPNIYTQADKFLFREELNAYKLNEMNVHQTSRVYTRELSCRITDVAQLTSAIAQIFLLDEFITPTYINPFSNPHLHPSSASSIVVSYWRLFNLD